MPKRRNYTQELLARRSRGAHIVVSLSPHVGVPVSYAPRHLKDPEPWDAGFAYRFNGRECHAVADQGVSAFNRDRFLTLIFELFNGAFEMGQDDFRFDFSVEETVSILAKLVDEGLLERKGGSYFMTRSGYSRVADLQEAVA